MGMSTRTTLTTTLERSKKAPTETCLTWNLDKDGTITILDHNLHVNQFAQTSNGVSGAILGDINLDGVVDVLGGRFHFDQ